METEEKGWKRMLERKSEVNWFFKMQYFTGEKKDLKVYDELY
jgi:hypothetical protein